VFDIGRAKARISYIEQANLASPRFQVRVGSLLCFDFLAGGTVPMDGSDLGSVGTRFCMAVDGWRKYVRSEAAAPGVNSRNHSQEADFSGPKKEPPAYCNRSDTWYNIVFPD
jgi:hypothetical protein